MAAVKAARPLRSGTPKSLPDTSFRHAPAISVTPLPTGSAQQAPSELMGSAVTLSNLSGIEAESQDSLKSAEFKLQQINSAFRKRLKTAKSDDVVLANSQAVDPELQRQQSIMAALMVKIEPGLESHIHFPFQATDEVEALRSFPPLGADNPLSG
jgi:hypothetical protein